MLDKTQVHITKSMWAIQDQIVTIMNKAETNVSLAKMAGLNIHNLYSQMINQELMNYFSDVMEGDEITRKRING